MRWTLAASVILIVLALALAVEARGLPPMLGNVSMSEKHMPTYLNMFTRFYFPDVTGYNYTINYTRIPRIDQGVRPRFAKPADLEADSVRSSERVILDPRTCPNDLAYCYQVRTRNSTPVLSVGKNYSSVSTYQLPEQRIKMFVCVGDDVACVRSATSCFCPTEEIGAPPIVWGRSAKCSDRTHLCLDTYGTFKLCEGNLSSCQEQHNVCGCGRYAACISSKRNACINERNELTLCAGPLTDCLVKYKTCYCGDEMMYMQNGCSALRHTCAKGNTTYTCYGKFQDCALKADTCGCGAP